MSLTVRLDMNVDGLDNLIRAAGPAANVGFSRAINKAGDVSRTRYLRQVREILGIRKHRYAKANFGFLMKKHSSTRRSTPGTLTYSVVGFGQGLNLIYYQPKETPAGASVMWLGQRKVVPRSFYLGGKFPRRKGGFGPKRGLVVQRTGAGINMMPRGPGLPEGMVQPSSIAVWNNAAQTRLPGLVAHELYAILMGYAPSGARASKGRR